jgi:subtilisin
MRKVPPDAPARFPLLRELLELSDGVKIPGKTVNRATADGSVLVEAVSAADLERLRRLSGVSVTPEHWYPLHRGYAWRRLSSGFNAPVKSGSGVTWKVQVLNGDAGRSPVRDAMVIVVVDSDKNIGVVGITNSKGIAEFELSKRTSVLESIDVLPLHGAWPMSLSWVRVSNAPLVVDVSALSTGHVDARNVLYGTAAAGAGQGVRVAVIDSGVGPHNHLTLEGGMNTTTEAKSLLDDWDGHGTHVAGVIAGKGPGGRRGEASAVSLRAYRIFEKGDEFASSFAISAAIKQAALDECDLINLSIGSEDVDQAILDAINFAWKLGAVCVAAAGNDGENRLSYPARHSNVLGVAAVGVEGTWPPGASQNTSHGRYFGISIGDRRVFSAGFTNFEDVVSLAAPGVGIISTIHGSRYGVMDGTSMATPVATGVLARKLSGSPELSMARDSARSNAISALALKGAEKLRLPADRQGSGLIR